MSAVNLLVCLFPEEVIGLVMHERFLADVCRAWEAAAWPAQDLGVRTVAVRIGVVLGRGGGALGKMLIPFRAGLGGPIGNGKQWVSWIHLTDVVGLVLAAVSSDKYTGPVNATAPTPVRNSDFTASLAKAVDRKAFLSVPGFALRLTVGEFADALITGQRVIPAKDEVVAAAERLACLHQQPGADLLERSQHGRGVVQPIDERRRSRWHRDDPLDHLERVGDLNWHPVHAAGKRDGGERAKCPCRKTRADVVAGFGRTFS